MAAPSMVIKPITSAHCAADDNSMRILNQHDLWFLSNQRSYYNNLEISIIGETLFSIKFKIEESSD